DTFPTSNGIIYLSQSDKFNSYPLAFNIGGAGNFKATSFTQNSGYVPSFSNADQLPDSVSKSSGFNFTLNNLANTASLTVELGNARKDVTGNTVSFSSGELNGVNVSSNVQLLVNLINSGNQTVTHGGKDYWLSGNRAVTKYVKVVP